MSAYMNVEKCSKKEISVIMPVYNSGFFLRESLRSILNQTFANFELICVNDASIDMSADILQEYADQDDRIIILTNHLRQGAAESRNRGMKVAKGNYLSFLDADDVFELDMLELAYEAMEEHQADIVIFEGKHIPTEKINETIKKTHTNEYREKYCSGLFYLKDCAPHESLSWMDTPWNKLYRRAFIENKKLKFQSLSCSNDVYFVDMALMSESKLIVLDNDRVMVHVRDHNSDTRISYNRDPMCCYQALEKIQKELIERGLFKDVFKHYYYMAFVDLVYATIKVKSIEQKKEFYDFLAQEGIRELRERGEAYYAQNDEYIRNVFERFENDSFESRWYVQEGILTIYLEKNKKFFIEFIKSSIHDGSKICIWGAGQNGRLLIDFFNNNGLTIDSVIDIDVNKEGTYVSGYKVNLPSSLLYESNMKYLVITSNILAEDSANRLKQESENDITVVGIHMLLNI